MGRAFRKLLILLCILGFSGNSFAAPNDFFIPYDKLLKKYVVRGDKDGMTANLVDYQAWGQDPLHQQAMVKLSAAQPQQLIHKNERLAFWINAYNLLTIDMIVKNNETSTVNNLGSLLHNQWQANKWKISGVEYSLDDIERNILQKIPDSRIYMAITYGTLSAPDLRNESYRAEIIDRQLDNQAEIFLTNPAKGAKVQNDKIAISPIFKQFSENFGGVAGVDLFIRKYFQNLNNDLPLEGYLAYNWNLNIKQN